MDSLRSIPQELLCIIGSYGMLLPIRSLAVPSSITFREFHKFLIDSILLSPHFLTYPPSKKYQSIFWKWATEILENLLIDEDDEIDERIYEKHVSLISSDYSRTIGVDVPQPSYLTYLWRNVASNSLETVTTMESRTTIESGTTGLKTWPASLALAQFVSSRVGLVKGKRVLEIGSGAGLLGSIVGALQQCQNLDGDEAEHRYALYLTDIREDVLRRCQNNVRLPCNRSSSHPRLRCSFLDWTDALDDQRRQHLIDSLADMSAEIVLGADVVYDPSIIPALVATIRLALGADEAATGSEPMALIAFPVRNTDTVSAFVRDAKEIMIVEEVEFDIGNTSVFIGINHPGEQSTKQDVKIFRMTRKHNEK